MQHENLWDNSANIYGFENRGNACISITILFDFVLYVPVNIFSVIAGWVFLGWNSTKQG